MARITNSEMVAAFHAVREAHRAAGITRTFTDYKVGIAQWNDANPDKAERIRTLSRTHRTQDSDVQRELEALVDERQQWERANPVVTVMGPDDMIFNQGSATYGNAWGIAYSPWHNPKSPHYHRAMSGHYSTDVPSLGTDRATALARMRSYVAGIYIVLNSQKA